MYGSFSDDANEVWDFVRCQRPDGTFYGTSGKCRSGTEVAAKLAKLPREKLKKLAEHPKLSPQQRAQVMEAIKRPAAPTGWPEAQKPAAPAEKPKKEAKAKPEPKPKAAKPTQEEKVKAAFDKMMSAPKGPEFEAAVKAYKKEKDKLNKAQGKPVEKPVASKPEAKPAAKAPAKGKATPEQIAEQKKKAEDLLKATKNAKSSSEEEKLFNQWKKEKAKYEKMAGINQGSAAAMKAAEKAQPQSTAAQGAAAAKKIKKLEEQAKTTAEEYKKHLEAGDMSKAAAAYKKGQKISQQLDEAKGISKGIAEKAAAERKAEEEKNATQKKINDRQRAANLSPAQKAAITQYTEEGVPFGYQQVNQCSRNPPSCEDPAQAKKFMKQFDSALKALPKNDDGDTFYRGIGVDNSGPTSKLYDALANAKRGQRFKDPGYGSYSSDQKQAAGFQYGSSGRRILFVSRSKGLTPVNVYSAIQSENEAVLPRGFQQTIRKVTRNGEELIVELD